METIGCVASVSQLVNYSYSAAQRLINLYRTMQEHPAVCRDQSQNIRCLLRLVERICNIKAPDNTEALLLLCISIADQASRLLNLLEPKEFLLSKWLWMAKGRDIERTFRSLRDKAKILQVHILERTYSFLCDISGRATSSNESVSMEHPHRANTHQNTQRTSRESDFVVGNPPRSARRAPYETSLAVYNGSISDNHRTGSTSSRPQIPLAGAHGHLSVQASSNTTKDRAVLRIGNGWEAKCSSADLKSDNNMVGARSKQDIGNC